MRLFWTTILLIAVPALARAECQPGKDFRTKPNAGIEIVDVSFSGASSLTTEELAEITSAMVGSCFDGGKDKKLEHHLFSRFQQAGYISASIDDLEVEETSADLVPAPVRVRARVAEGEKCPKNSDQKGLYQFLLDHRSNNLAANPECAGRAFAALGHDRSYTKALIQFLDFERNDEHDGMRGLSSRYPAIEALDSPASVPYLLDAIKHNNSELIRTNSAEAIRLIYNACPRAAVAMLKREAEKPETKPRQKERLQVAAMSIEDHYNGSSMPCRSDRGAPSSEEEFQKNIESLGQPLR